MSLYVYVCIYVSAQLIWCFLYVCSCVGVQPPPPSVLVAVLEEAGAVRPAPCAAREALLLPGALPANLTPQLVSTGPLLVINFGSESYLGKPPVLLLLTAFSYHLQGIFRTQDYFFCEYRWIKDLCINLRI